MYDSSLSVNVKTTMFNITYGDLFQASNPSSSLAHCVSSDFKCGKGIATVFIQKFVRIKEFRGKNFPVGQVAVLKEGNRYIYEALHLRIPAKFGKFRYGMVESAILPF